MSGLGPGDCYSVIGPCPWIPRGGSHCRHSTPWSGLSGCAVLDPPHQAIGPSQTLQDDVRKHKLAGLKGHREKCVCVWVLCFQLWFPKGQSSLLFTEGPHEQSPWRPSLGEGDTPSLGWVFFPISTHTDFSKTCFSEARTQKARCTTRPPSPGLEHVRIIYMPEFYVFNVSMKHRQCEREPGPDMLSVKRYVCCSSIFVCCVKASIEAKGDVCISEKINCISFQYIPLYILVSVYFLFIVDKRTQAAPRPAS